MNLSTTRHLVMAGDEDDLSTEQLLAIVVNSRSVARRILSRFGTLGCIEEATAIDLLEVPDVGPRRAAVMRAVLALARRRRKESSSRGRSIGCSRDVFEAVHPLIGHENREVLVALALDARNRLLRSPCTVSIGSLTQAAVEPREILRPLILAAAASTVLAHNHPSTCPEPSVEDVTLSQAAFEACALVGIKLLDHVVIGDDRYVSLADRGLL